MNQDNHHTIRLQFLLIAVLIIMTAGLAYVLLTLPEVAPGLSIQVTQNLQLSGVENPVTAVLLNFRAYDTLLELGVLLLALLAVWSLGTLPKFRETAPGAILETLSAVLIPLLILVAGYLLWVGASAPGGAFQAGAVDHHRRFLYRAVPQYVSGRKLCDFHSPGLHSGRRSRVYGSSKDDDGHDAQAH